MTFVVYTGIEKVWASRLTAVEAPVFFHFRVRQFSFEGYGQEGTESKAFLYLRLNEVVWI